MHALLGRHVSDRLPEVACHIKALMIAIQHVDCAALHSCLPVKLSQQQDGTCRPVHFSW